MKFLLLAGAFLALLYHISVRNAIPLSRVHKIFAFLKKRYWKNKKGRKGE
jgi:hypothetical protein